MSPPSLPHRSPSLPSSRQKGRRRSDGGVCGVCSRQFVDLLDHVRKKHALTVFGPKSRPGGNLVHCQCGRACANEAGLGKHRYRYCRLRATQTPHPTIIRPTPDASRKMRDSPRRDTADSGDGEHEAIFKHNRPPKSGSPDSKSWQRDMKRRAAAKKISDTQRSFCREPRHPDNKGGYEGCEPKVKFELP